MFAWQLTNAELLQELTLRRQALAVKSAARSVVQPRGQRKASGVAEQARKGFRPRTLTRMGAKALSAVAMGQAHREVERVTIVGSGNWGTAVARIVGLNCTKNQKFDTEVRMWCFEEMVDGRKLSEIINTEHENVKYLPGVKLPPNVRAVPDIKEAVDGASLLLFVMPHQFLARVCNDMDKSWAENAMALSLIKAIDFKDDRPFLITDTIKNHMGIGMDVSVLSGANVASEVASDQFCESTVGTSNMRAGLIWKELLDRPNFRINVVTDVPGVELSGALKNVVALGAGYCDGLGYGGNTKAAIIRLGLLEIQSFIGRFYPNVQISTFFESCGVADLITTCYGGRNRLCAEEFVRSGKDWEEIEANLLNGQKLQGLETAEGVMKVLRANNLVEQFPLMSTIYQIAYEGRPPENIVQFDNVECKW